VNWSGTAKVKLGWPAKQKSELAGMGPDGLCVANRQG
jgi:hypothetical protein